MRTKTKSLIEASREAGKLLADLYAAGAGYLSEAMASRIVQVGQALERATTDAEHEISDAAHAAEVTR